jgi:proline iminopeptidase
MGVVGRPGAAALAPECGIRSRRRASFKTPTPRAATMVEPMRSSAAIPALLLATAGCFAFEPASGQPPVEDGFARMDDGTRLYYEVVGEGEPVVVVPMAMYLSELLAPLAEGRRIVFYDPRNRGRSDAADLATVSLDRQLLDLDQLRAALGVEKMALIGWSGLGMEMAAYTIRHPDRVTRLVQVSPVPPTSAMMATIGDRRSGRVDRAAVAAIDSLAEAGEIDSAEHCRRRRALTERSNFEDPSLAERVPDPCRHENEWPVNLWPYFDALLGSFGEYDWLPELEALTTPRLVIHGREDGIPVEGGRAWAAGFPNARLIVLSPAGHFPFLEQPAAFFPAVGRFLDGEWPEEAMPVEE